MTPCVDHFKTQAIVVDGGNKLGPGINTMHIRVHLDRHSSDKSTCGNCISCNTELQMRPIGREITAVFRMTCQSHSAQFDIFQTSAAVQFGDSFLWDFT